MSQTATPKGSFRIAGGPTSPVASPACVRANVGGIVESPRGTSAGGVRSSGSPRRSSGIKWLGAERRGCGPGYSVGAPGERTGSGVRSGVGVLVGSGVFVGVFV